MSHNFDATLNQLEAIRFLNKWRRQIKLLKKSTFFTEDELKNLFLIHYKIVKELGPMTFQRFADFCYHSLGITEQKFYEKIFTHFDPFHKNEINPYHWANELSVMLGNNLREQIVFVWLVYVPTGQEYITKGTLMAYLKTDIIKSKTDSSMSYDSLVKDFVNLVHRKLDVDLDGKISFNDFKHAVTSNPLLLECLGQCLPSSQAAAAFLATFSTRPIYIQIVPFSATKYTKAEQLRYRSLLKRKGLDSPVDCLND